MVLPKFTKVYCSENKFQLYVETSIGCISRSGMACYYTNSAVLTWITTSTHLLGDFLASTPPLHKACQLLDFHRALVDGFASQRQATLFEQ